MRVGIRAKEVALLTLVALLPLLAALAVIVFIETDRRTQSFGMSILSVTVAEARAMEIRLTADVEKLELALHQPAVGGVLAAEQDRQLSAAELQALDKAWADVSSEPPELAGVLEHPISSVLRLAQNYDPRIAEAMVTDRHGRLVAATGRTSDFYQADEDWWQRAYAGGTGRVYIPRVNYDVSAGVWSMDLCVPVRSGGRVVGVAKVVVDAAQLIGGPMRTVGEVSAPVSLIAHDGKIIFGEDAMPMTTEAEEWTGAIATGDVPGWRRTRAGTIQAFAPIRLPGRIGPHEVEMPNWTLALAAPASAVQAPIMRLGAALLLAGMTVIGGIFIGGLALVEREVVGRIRRIGRAARRVAGGDLAHRAPPSRPLAPWLGRDELDELTDDFNDMVARLEHSYRDLEAADELKTNFIRVAGHELRTPVSYIVGIGALLRDSEDPQRLSEALQAAAAKGRRLEEIIRAMFKLMPEDGAPARLRREQVDLRRVVEAVAGQSRMQLEHRRLRLTIDVAPEAQEIPADRAKVRDMVDNLLQNAIRFTPEGGEITIRIEQEAPGAIVIAVENEGAQIPAEDVEHLFEPFFCATDVMTHSTGGGFQQRGVGLGLAIVRHFALLHGGDARVWPGERGPVFEIILPAPAPRTAEAGAGKE